MTAYEKWAVPCPFIACLLAALAGGWLLGCAYPPAPPSEELHRYNWWNYYRRGLECIRRQDYQRAREDLETCLGLRSGARSTYGRDSWRERTYGLHTIDNYFPHRELGICFYYLGDYSNAIPCLQRSLRFEPSGRAKHYLNLARRRSLRSCLPPSISLFDDPTVFWTCDREKTVAGKAVGSGFIAELAIGGRRQFIELSEETQTFSEKIVLREGSNLVSIVAQDLLGQTARENRLWLADWHPPQLVVMKREPMRAGLRLSGVCYDNEALASVTASGRNLFSADFRNRTREFNFQIDLRSDEAAVMKAEDLAGNSIELLIHPEDYALQETSPTVELASNAESIPASTSKTALDHAAPVLRLFDSQPAITVYGNEFYLDGEALDGGGLAEVVVNGEEWLRPEHRGAQRRRFAGFLRVEGTNVFTVSVRDLAGNETRQTVAVMARVPEYLSEKYRLRAALLPWREGPSPSWLTCDEVSESISENIARPPIRFRLLARGDEWTEILHELRLSVSELADPRTALQIGRILPADLLFAGSFFEDAEGLTIYMRIIDTTDATVLYATDIYTERQRNDWRFQVEGLVSKMEQYFPLIESRITARRPKTVTIAAGRRDGVKPGTRFIVLHSDQTDEVLGEADRFVELVVSEVEPKQSMARIVPVSGEEAPRKGERIYSR